MQWCNTLTVMWVRVQSKVSLLLHMPSPAFFACTESFSRYFCCFGAHRVCRFRFTHLISIHSPLSFTKHWFSWAANTTNLWLLSKFPKWYGKINPSNVHFCSQYLLRIWKSHTRGIRCSVFWDTLPCSLFKAIRRSGGTCFMFLQRRKISQARNQHEANCDVFPRNVGWLLIGYKVLFPSGQNS
jgi:hypothetical protein